MKTDFIILSFSFEYETKIYSLVGEQFLRYDSCVTVAL